MIYQPHVSAQIIAAMESVALANNGYARMPLRGDVASALRLAGYRVERAGLNSYVVYSAHAWACLVAERNAELRRLIDGAECIDYEAAILNRNVDHLFA